MWIGDWPPYPMSSFVEPVLPPASDPASAPLACVPVNLTWLKYLAGAATQLCNPATWDTGDLSLMLQTLQYATDLVRTICNAVACGMYQERFFECQLEYSTDGGLTWLAVPGWGTGFQTCVIANQAYAIMASGVIDPPVPVWTSDGTDWVYGTLP